MAEKTYTFETAIADAKTLDRIRELFNSWGDYGAVIQTVDEFHALVDKGIQLAESLEDALTLKSCIGDYNYDYWDTRAAAQARKRVLTKCLSLVEDGADLATVCEWFNHSDTLEWRSCWTLIFAKADELDIEDCAEGES